MNRITIVVQARMSSSRLPKKVLLPILDEPLLFRMIERLKQIKRPVELVVATSTSEEDNAIELFCDTENIKCYRGDLNNLLDRHYQVGLLTNADAVVKIPSDCPLIDPRIVDRLLDFYDAHSDEFDFVSNLHPATYPDGNDVEIMSMNCLKKAWEEAKRPLELEHTTPYIWENPEKFSIANLTWETGLDYSMSHRLTIDYYEDYLFIKRIFEELYPINPSFSLDDILTLLTQKPSVYEINQHFAGVNWYRNHLEDLKTVSAEQTKSI
jgi:spore coat polysaccharide biosynthesis protein SpsF